MNDYGEPNPQRPKYTVINWNGTRYYRYCGQSNEVRSASCYERGAIRCKSIKQIISEFRLGGYTVDDWTVL